MCANLRLTGEDDSERKGALSLGEADPHQGK